MKEEEQIRRSKKKQRQSCRKQSSTQYFHCNRNLRKKIYFPWFNLLPPFVFVGSPESQKQNGIHHENDMQDY